MSFCLSRPKSLLRCLQPVYTVFTLITHGSIMLSISIK